MIEYNGTNEKYDLADCPDVMALVAKFANKNKLRCVLTLTKDGKPLNEDDTIAAAGLGNGEQLVISTDPRLR
ncbi:hypothetical protein TRFO_13296 [Tritrichomonas foetus]|uniref:Ubiquitin-like domain-containing protein n=1 Tax=Tritrichomonas foetus TaxID=1144522 RepID=A0A1J4KZJ9_9EUKA|nr:hypothetical protein TRFO_13296 [Tritrichomonas foetus]|eukprot:OHT16288.1 hypothetical protein TRFO_13296 [Tritrichomonas foetus]